MESLRPFILPHAVCAVIVTVFVSTILAAENIIDACIINTSNSISHTTRNIEDTIRSDNQTVNVKETPNNSGPRTPVRHPSSAARASLLGRQSTPRRLPKPLPFQSPSKNVSFKAEVPEICIRTPASSSLSTISCLIDPTESNAPSRISANGFQNGISETSDQNDDDEINAETSFESRTESLLSTMTRNSSIYSTPGSLLDESARSTLLTCYYKPPSYDSKDTFELSDFVQRLLSDGFEVLKVKDGRRRLRKLKMNSLGNLVWDNAFSQSITTPIRTCTLEWPITDLLRIISSEDIESRQKDDCSLISLVFTRVVVRLSAPIAEGNYLAYGFHRLSTAVAKDPLYRPWRERQKILISKK